MNSTQSRLPLAGVVFAAVLIVHAAVGGSAVPTQSAPAADILAYVSDKQAELQWGAYLQGIAVIALLVFVSSFVQVAGQARDRTTGGIASVPLAGAVALVALLGVHIGLLTTLALQADAGIEAATVEALWVLAFLILGLSSFSAAAMMGGLGVLILGSADLPKPLGVVALINAGMWLVAGMAGASTASVWGYAGFAAFATWLLWTAVAGVLAARVRVGVAS